MSESVPELPEWATFDGVQVVARVDRIQTYDENPRDPADTDFGMSADFRLLVQSIEQAGITNPLQVYFDNGKFHLIAGHRRLAAIHELNRQRETAWESQGSQGEWDRIDTVPISLQKKPESPYLRQMAMWNAEETKADWPESRRFNFFCRTFDSAPTYLQTDPKKLAAALGMRLSTIRTYLRIRENRVLSEAMGNPGNSPIPRAGRHKVIRSLARLLDDLVKHRDAVVRVATGLAPSSDQAKEVLANSLLTKRRQYAENPHISVGPGSALERTLPLIDPGHRAKVTNEELIAWLSDASVLRPDFIEKRIALQADSELSGLKTPSGASIQSLLIDLKKDKRITKRPGSMTEKNLEIYLDTMTEITDFVAENTQKARKSIKAMQSV